MDDFFGEQGILFYENVLTSTKTLISSGLWKDVNIRSLERWTDYFEGHEEKVLCGLLLDSLTYRSRVQTQALLFNVLEKSIPQILRNSSLNLEKSLYGTLTAKYPGRDKNKIKIVPVISDIDPPTKSGPLVARLYKKEVGVNERFMEWPWKLESHSSEVELVIFIDDFVGSGDQFLEFLERFFPEGNFNDGTQYVYAPLGACKSGVENIVKKAPRVKVCHAEMVEEENYFFSGLTSRYKELGVECEDAIKVIYENFMKKVGLGRLKHKYGYGALELTYAYAHGTPNATLPVFWAANEHYQPVFSR